MNPKDFQSERPTVSVIIPFYNNQDEVVRIEEHIRNQTYPESNLEVIFVDNGSEDSYQFQESFLKRNILLTEKKYLNSPYSARNRGIEASTGEIIVFVDANSFPEGDWLEQGVNCLRDSGKDLMGGNVLFDFQDEMTAAKIVDSLTSIQMKDAIEKRGVAYTANLFVKRCVFDQIGHFEERSAIRW
ncbi:MAG: glycosyltransferase [Balneolaceae bacterium]|nr:glycosyltransferase [Balneolaceae bacterium]